MTVAVVVIGTGALLVALLAIARWRTSGDQLPLFVADNRCPICEHHIHDHFIASRLSGVFAGCDVSGCECTTPITRMPGPH